VIDVNKINELLDVNKYIEAWPLIPKEELHASDFDTGRSAKRHAKECGKKLPCFRGNIL